MEDNLQMGLSMLVIGMTTVFFILFFVVAGGNILIRFVNNRYPLDEEVTSLEKPVDNNPKIAAIVAAVDIISGGKGKASSIRKSVS